MREQRPLWQYAQPWICCEYRSKKYRDGSNHYKLLHRLMFDYMQPPQKIPFPRFSPSSLNLDGREQAGRDGVHRSCAQMCETVSVSVCVCIRSCLYVFWCEFIICTCVHMFSKHVCINMHFINSEASLRQIRDFFSVVLTDLESSKGPWQPHPSGSISVTTVRGASKGILK